MRANLICMTTVSAMLLGCTKPNPTVCCETQQQCDAIGVGDLRPCTDGLVCGDENRCVEHLDAGVDARPDAPIDAPGAHVFDVAYPHEWRFSVTGPIRGYFLVINTSGTALDMNTLELKSIDDDHPTAIVRVTVTPSSASIPPGQVGGALSGLSTQLLVGTGLVSEPRFDTTSDYLTLAVENAPVGTYDINVVLELAIDGVRIPMPLKVHIVPPPDVYADPLAGRRTPIYR